MSDTSDTKQDTKTTDEKKEGNMRIHLPAEILNTFDKDGFKYIKIECSAIEFIKQAMTSELIYEFINDTNTKKFLCKVIGIETLTECYDELLLLDHLPWATVKPFYLDHMAPEEIMNTIGYEKFRDYFKDVIEQEFSPGNAINSSDDTQKGVLGAINGAEAQNS